MLDNSHCAISLSHRTNNSDLCYFTSIDKDIFELDKREDLLKVRYPINY